MAAGRLSGSLLLERGTEFVLSVVLRCGEDGEGRIVSMVGLLLFFVVASLQNMSITQGSLWIADVKCDEQR